MKGASGYKLTMTRADSHRPDLLPLPLRRVAGWVFLLALGFCTAAFGEVRLALPLQGHYRVGRYMPVQIRAQGMDGSAVQLSGSGLLSTSMALSDGRGEGIVPALVLQSPLWQLQWAGPDGQEHAVGLPLHELSADQHLIGALDVERSAAEALFPNQHAIVVRLDPDTFFSAPAVAWTSLDALLMTRAGFERLGAAQRETLLAGGVDLAVMGEGSAAPPDGVWPWQKRGEWWVMAARLGGPASARFNVEAYQPTYSWAGEWPGGFRGRIGLAAAGLSILILLAALLRPGWALPLAGASVVVGMVLIGLWRAHHSPLLHVEGRVEVVLDGLIQRDQWFYQSAPDATAGGFAFDGLTYPVFADAAHAASLHPRLVCRSDGRPAFFDYRLPAQARIALLQRSIAPGAAPAALSPAGPSGLRELVRALYLTPGHALAGQIPAPQATWPTLVIQGHR
jgi:hypothetical protein